MRNLGNMWKKFRGGFLGMILPKILQESCPPRIPARILSSNHPSFHARIMSSNHPRNFFHLFRKFLIFFTFTPFSPKSYFKRPFVFNDVCQNLASEMSWRIDELWVNTFSNFQLPAKFCQSGLELDCHWR